MGAVERQTDKHIFGHRVEDRCVGIIGYPGEVEGVIENEMNSSYEVGATIYGTDGMIYVQDNSMRYFTAKSNGWVTFEPTEAEREGYGRSHIDQAYGIVEWIEGKNEDYRGQAKYGRQAIEIMMAVYESARCHERVNCHCSRVPTRLMWQSKPASSPSPDPGFMMNGRFWCVAKA